MSGDWSWRGDSYDGILDIFLRYAKIISLLNELTYFMEFNFNEKSFDEVEEKIGKIKNDIEHNKAMEEFEKFGSDAMKSISDLISEG